MNRKILIIATVGILSIICVKAQGDFAVKTNLLYGIGTRTPNLGVGFSLGKHSTIDLSGGYNPWNRKGTDADNKKMVHWLIQPEYRYWPCEVFNGSFFGIHAIGTQYNISGMSIALLLENQAKNFRYAGYGIGAGVSYGYNIMLNKSINLEFTAGVGYMRMLYDKYDCVRCGEQISKDQTRDYFGPTKAGVSLIYLIR